MLGISQASVLAPPPLLFAVMSYSYSGHDLTDRRLALHQNPISMALRDVKGVNFNNGGSDPDAKEEKQKRETEQPPPTAQAQ